MRSNDSFYRHLHIDKSSLFLHTQIILLCIFPFSSVRHLCYRSTKRRDLIMQPVLVFFLSLFLVHASLLSPVLAHDDDVSVMTQNQYLGADFTPIVTAPNAAAFNQAVLTA